MTGSINAMTEPRDTRERRRRKNRMRRRLYCLLHRAVVLTVLLLLALALLRRADAFEIRTAEGLGTESVGTIRARKAVEAAAQKAGYSLADYPQELLRLYEKNPEARQFVLDYTPKREADAFIDLSEYADCEEVPLLLQWDERWGYCEYAGNLLGITGCGPTCLSMVTVYLTKDTKKNPAWMAEFAREHDYYENGSGSKWTLMSEGAAFLGLEARELSLDEERMREEVSAGNPIICILGPGDFTDSGHFIVLAGYGDKGFVVNDPNSPARSGRIWSFEELRDQIRNLWVFQRQA